MRAEARRQLTFNAKEFSLQLHQRYLQKFPKILDQISGKDLLLVIGSTGVGKSLLIRFLQGNQDLAVPVP